ncbi:hypothetical protein BJD52_gp15 [Salmonella phage BP12B]|uniref:Uncharacterized protein n=1 Tax=Salmonella phage BP12B TaxID=1543201 RepID=A0A140XFS0_9CAUD|nr:hypothetical protein BJD52_gp15 [Salmonella phage BP12B]AIT13690.1 hypothetical protein BP12B_15 [Salmonella phage BP12B]QZQ75069.1 hypothetical protein [Salmonella phage vB_SenAt-pSL2]HBL6576691.1 hypothetical protein [Salmonella enterica subsp. enterica serovar Typhimurium]
MTKELNTKIEVIFKRSLSDILGGTPRVAEFEGMLHYGITKEGALYIGWRNRRYVYPAHRIKRIKITE